MMVTVRAGTLAAALLFFAVVAGCSREQQDWRSAEGADSIEAYGRFIEHHPESELATQARTRISQLGEERDWQAAASADSADGYRQFLAQHPNGKWTQEARIRIENFALGAGQAAPAGATHASAAAPAITPGETATLPPPQSQPRPVPLSRPAPSIAAVSQLGSPPLVAATGASPSQPAAGSQPAVPKGTATGYGIQLGAFSSQDKATAEWGLLTGRFGSQLAGLVARVVPAGTSAAPLFRLQASVGAEPQARAICEALRRQGQGCVPVLPH